jgi:hypothetical protein
VGLPGFEPGSKAPEASSLDQTSRQPLFSRLEPRQSINDFPLIVKTIAKLQHLTKTTQRAIGYRLTRLNKLANLQNPIDVQKAVYRLECRNNYKNKLLLAYQYFCQANCFMVSYIRTVFPGHSECSQNKNQAYCKKHKPNNLEYACYQLTSSFFTALLLISITVARAYSALSC